MLRALFKKQLMELFSFYFRDRRTGKRRTKTGAILCSVLYVALFLYMGVLFFLLADAIIEPMLTLGMGWMYFCLIGLLATFMGVFGSVFSAYSGLFLAKDNEFLLSLPIPSRHIVFVRLSGVTVTALLYESMVLVPGLIVRFLHGRLSAAVVIGTLLTCVDITVLVTVLTCLLGWIVALIAVRVKGKSWITALLTLALLGGYFYFMLSVPHFFDNIAVNVIGLFGKLKQWLYPWYVMGCAAQGDVPAMLGLTAVSFAALAVTWTVLSRTFLRIALRAQAATTRRRTKVDFARVGSRSLDMALIYKEWRRFTSSATYMLNAGLSSVLLPALAIAAVINRGALTGMLGMMQGFVTAADGFMALALAGIVCLVAGMNMVTAPSVSLEGRNIWIPQSLPVPPVRALRAKIALHLLITLPPALLAVGLLAWVLGVSFAQAVLVGACVTVFVLLVAQAGLAINLKTPNLAWTSEVVPVKQGLSVMLTLLCGMGLIVALGGIYFLLREAVTPVVYLALCTALFAAANAAVALWLRGRGARIYARL